VSLFPIDTLKTRLQAREGFVRSGGFAGVYKGIGSAIVGSAPGAALFFVTYDSIKQLLASRRTSHVGHSTTSTGFMLSEPAEHMLAASCGEVMACLVRVPTEVIKQRTQALQHATSAATLRHILGQRKTLGFAAVWSELYRGWGVTVMREIPFTMIQFPLWEGMKRVRRTYTGQQTNKPLESAFFGSIAGAVAAAITTPLDVIKTRIMLSKGKIPIGSVARSIIEENGVRALFAGIGPRVFWISTGGAIFLGSYEAASNFLAQRI